MSTRSFLAKLVLFLAAVVVAQVGIAHYLSPPVEKSRVDQLLAEKARIVLFGDSGNWNVSEGDTDQANLWQMLAREMHGTTLSNLGHPAYHLDIFAAEMEYISRSAYRPEAVIVPIQLREFSPEWDMRPVNQFEKDMFFLTDRTSFASYFFTPLAIFRAVEANTISYMEFLQTPVFYGTAPVGVVNDFEALDKRKPATEENIRRDYIYKYMPALSPDHRKLRSLDKLLAIARAAGIKVYPYISPIDYQLGEKYVGEDFVKQTTANASLIGDFLDARSTPCLDLTFSLGSEVFDHPPYPNEHLNQTGRMFVVRSIIEFFLNEAPTAGGGRKWSVSSGAASAGGARQGEARIEPAKSARAAE